MANKKATRRPKKPMADDLLAQKMTETTTMTKVRTAAARAGIPLPTTWSDMSKLIAQQGLPLLMICAIGYWFATRVDAKLDSHISEQKELVSLQRQELDVLWQMASSSQRACINLAKVAKTDPIECTILMPTTRKPQ